MAKRPCHDHQWSELRHIREPAFGVTLATWRVCRACGWREHEDLGGSLRLRRPERACDATVAVLKETGNPFVRWGDEDLLHKIAERLGWEHAAHTTSQRVLRALSVAPGPLRKSLVRAGRGHGLLKFDLPLEEGDGHVLDSAGRAAMQDFSRHRVGRTSLRNRTL